MTKEKKLLMDSDLDSVIGGADWTVTIYRDSKGLLAYSVEPIVKKGEPERMSEDFSGNGAIYCLKFFMKEHSGDKFLTPDGKPFKLPD